MSDYISELVCSQLTAEYSTSVFLTVSSVKCLVPCKSNVAERGSKLACLVLDVTAGRGNRKGRLVGFFVFFSRRSAFKCWCFGMQTTWLVSFLRSIFMKVSVYAVVEKLIWTIYFRQPHSVLSYLCGKCSWLTLFWWKGHQHKSNILFISCFCN